MAQKSKPLNKIFARAEQEEPEEQPAASQPEAPDIADIDLDEGITVTAGVGITLNEKQAYELLADKHETTKNALMRIALRYFLEQVIAGKVDPEAFLNTPPTPGKRSIYGRQSKRK